METQAQLAHLLVEAGFNVTQATVSRDIKELGLIKVNSGENNYRYAIPAESPKNNLFQRLKRLFKDSVLEMNDSENLILIKTLPGAANAVASCIDNIGISEIIGTLAGDDTILVVVKPKSAVTRLLKQFQEMLG